jgi:Phytanoyl-CoA dioxygenase (PhyH)
MTIQADNLPWTESPFFERELQESTLSTEDKAFVKDFSENGYAVFDPGLGLSVIDSLVDSMKPHFAKIEGEDKRVQDAWTYNEWVKKVAVSDTVLHKLRILYRREPIPFQTLNFAVGTQQKTHSDMVHFNSIPHRFMCGVWVAYEDITENNGPLHYYPKSHKLPFYDMIDMV